MTYLKAFWRGIKDIIKINYDEIVYRVKYYRGEKLACKIAKDVSDWIDMQPKPHWGPAEGETWPDIDPYILAILPPSAEERQTSRRFLKDIMESNLQILKVLGEKDEEKVYKFKV